MVRYLANYWYNGADLKKEKVFIINNGGQNYKKILTFLGNLFFAYAVIIAFALILFSSVTIECDVIGASMMPTYNNYVSDKCHDVVYVNTCDKKFSYGDIIVVKTGKESIIKRVIALPGDTIDIVEDGGEYKVERNGEILQENYIYYDYSPSVPANEKNGMFDNNGINGTYSRFLLLKSTKPELFKDGKLVVPENEIFVLGDHRWVSLDSSHYGTFKMSEIEGKVERVRYFGQSEFKFYYDYIVRGEFFSTIVNLFWKNIVL